MKTLKNSIVIILSILIVSSSFGQSINKSQHEQKGIENNIKDSTNQVGTIAKEFKGQDLLTGKIISLSDFKGKFVYLDFWGSWCKPCLEEVKYVRDAYQNLNKDSIVFIGIATDFDKSKFIKVLEEKQINWYQILYLELNKEMKITSEIIYQGINKDYNVTGWPTTFLIGPDGKIIAKNIRGKNLINELKFKLKQNN